MTFTSNLIQMVIFLPDYLKNVNFAMINLNFQHLDDIYKVHLPQVYVTLVHFGYPV